MGNNAGTSLSDLFPQLGANWQQLPPGPALICRIHTSYSHHAPHQCSDSAEEWIRPGAKHPPHPRTKQVNPAYLYQAELSAVVDSRLPDGLK